MELFVSAPKKERKHKKNNTVLAAEKVLRQRCGFHSPTLFLKWILRSKVMKLIQTRLTGPVNLTSMMPDGLMSQR